MEKIKVANKYQKSIDLLNDALGKEIATSLQYMYFHVHFEDAGYEYLSKKMRMIPSPKCVTARSCPTVSSSCRGT